MSDTSPWPGLIDALKRDLDAMPKQGETWIHLATRRTYEITDIAAMQCSRFRPLDDVKAVVYRSTRGGPIWVRPMAEFQEKFMHWEPLT